jgi:hypothetical protein
MPSKFEPRHMLDNTNVIYEIAEEAEPKLDLNRTQRIDRESGLPMWTVALYARGRVAGKKWNAVMNVTVCSAEKPPAAEGEQVIPVELEAMFWTRERKERDGVKFDSGTTYKCTALALVNVPDDVRAADLSGAAA